MESADMAGADLKQVGSAKSAAMVMEEQMESADMTGADLK